MQPGGAPLKLLIAPWKNPATQLDARWACHWGM
jgi:hypothetical protein